MVWPIYSLYRSIYFLNFVIIEMREKLRSQRETVISLPKPWDSRRNHKTGMLYYDQTWKYIGNQLYYFSPLNNGLV